MLVHFSEFQINVEFYWSFLWNYHNYLFIETENLLIYIYLTKWISGLTLSSFEMLKQESGISQNYKIAQSICTHYSCFENMGRFVTLKKIRSKIWTWKKQGAKKQGHCYSKREEARLLLLFLNNNDPVFLHPAFFWTWSF